LPLTKKLAELLGGGVSVVSNPGEGSVFTVTVPRLYQQTTEASEADAAWTPEPGRLAILTVEDDAADSFVFERALAGTRYQMLPARSLAEAKRALERVTPAAVLLDILLAGEESWRFLIEMKQRPPTGHIPIIVVSTAIDEHKARGLGADEYLAKPINRDRLVRVLDKVTGGLSVTKVLVVDDEEVARYLVRQLLPLGAFQVSEAANGIDGLKRAEGDRPDVVLFDLKMPDMDGFEFLERLSRGDATESIPAIALTSMRLSAEDRQQLRRAVQIIPKSMLSADVLFSAIREAVDSRHQPPR
jgi:CheY-like chemotaxis protein